MFTIVARLRARGSAATLQRQLDSCLEAVAALERGGSEIHEADVGRFNDAGDLLRRRGRTEEALRYYERAVDLYVAAGSLEKAAALCHKVLRNTPDLAGHSAIYHTLGTISARKGLASDARKHFLEYADRMRREGRSDEAGRTLAELVMLSRDVAAESPALFREPTSGARASAFAPAASAAEIGRPEYPSSGEPPDDSRDPSAVDVGQPVRALPTSAAADKPGEAPYGAARGEPRTELYGEPADSVGRDFGVPALVPMQATRGTGEPTVPTFQAEDTGEIRLILPNDAVGALRPWAR